jgi:hypothetical protein
VLARIGAISKGQSLCKDLLIGPPSAILPFNPMRKQASGKIKEAPPFGGLVDITDVPKVFEILRGASFFYFWTAMTRQLDGFLVFILFFLTPSSSH